MSLHQMLRQIKRAVPLIVIAGLAYVTYVACYVVAYEEYYLRHRRAPALVLWILMGILEAMIIVYWAAILIQGCGTYPKFPTFDLYHLKEPDTLPEPFAFLSDEQGFPFWCTRCQNLKPNRTFHLTDADKCVPKFDHYCMWIGTAIGRDNYVAFIKFLQVFLCYLVIVLILISATKVPVIQRAPFKLRHYIATFILVSFLMSMIFALYVMVFVNMVVNITTLDEITAKQARTYQRYTENEVRKSSTHSWCTGKVPRIESGRRYINISHRDTRVVVPFHVKSTPYSLGFKKNLINTVLNGNISGFDSPRGNNERLFWKALLVCFVPFVDLYYSSRARKNIPTTYEGCADSFSPKFIEFLRATIDAGKFEYALYVNKRSPSFEPNPE